MYTEWTTASHKASQPMKWYDWMTIAIVAASAALAIVGWIVFDGTRAL